MANSVDPDLMLHSAASDLGLHCLQRPICPNTKGYYGIFFCHLLVLHKQSFEIEVKLFWYENVSLICIYFCSAEGKAKMATILDQKNYLEELNRHLK